MPERARQRGFPPDRLDPELHLTGAVVLAHHEPLGARLQVAGEGS
jgi:hypothetical protein